jgi:hypothetical protein
MYVFALPLALEMPFVLSLWLKNPPEYAALFTRLALFDALIESISALLMAAVQATGKIKAYQSVVGGILLLNLPTSWIAVYAGFPAWSVMVDCPVYQFRQSGRRCFSGAYQQIITV